MANNLENKDAYIIIGIDEQDNYKLKGVENDTNGRNTQIAVDFLKDKKFAGEIRPKVYVKTMIRRFSLICKCFIFPQVLIWGIFC